MTDYAKVPIRQFPKLPSNRTPEWNFWQKYGAPTVVKEYASVSSIRFSEQSPHDFVVTASTRVQIYSARTHTVRKTISRFKETALGGKMRPDGKVLVAGDTSGLIQIFDVNSRSILRTLRGHEGPVHVTEFAPGAPTTLFSAADDKTVRVWDVPAQMPVHTFTGHEDYIRAGTILPGSPSLFLTGGYDHTLRLWDTRAPGEATMTIQYEAPIEALIAIPGTGGLLIAAAGGPQVSLLDLTGGGRALQHLRNHQKTVTTLTTDGEGRRLLSGGLDGLVKVYDTAGGQVLHSAKYPAPILSLAMSPDDTHVVAGMSSGLLSIRQRKLTSGEKREREARADARVAALTGMLRPSAGPSGPSDPSSQGWVVERTRHARLAPYDKFIKSFSYGQALDAVMVKGTRGEVVVSLLEELRRRSGLRTALSGRDEETLSPILRFLHRFSTRPRYLPTIIETLEVILSIYEDTFVESPRIGRLLLRTKRRLDEELRIQDGITQLQGAIGMIMSVRGLSALSI